ncbi:Cof-type HAD-IIB family hydrolase [Paenibacillus filicis]|uniref:Cof-type HAD-IIB family hydrolase n=1 Tax=Paenibacillus gyeongsangnamensis TaxID=3388067 RepID=A0ABT4Q3Y8_9BACL|nr:Cof-type HAD-IIB family hydrolase [Paenibacillus filicis]MCZ8511586.1 Cof-type HAD-IIB family hydrolase [Paenibacillus filicis]
MQKYAFFFDFDGTLYSHSTKSVPQSAQEALCKLQADGHTIIIATGRGPNSMELIQRELACSCDTMILLNGQLVFHKGRKIFEQFVPQSTLREFLGKAREYGFAYGGYCVNGEVVDHMNKRVAAVWNDFHNPIPAVLERFEEKYPLYQGHLYITREESDVLNEYLNDYVMNWSHEYLVNLISKEAGKSRGIRWLLERYGIPKEHSFAFGDGYNDKDMLQFVAHGIAMGNALDDLKQVAEHVTDSVDEDGIANALSLYNVI